MKKTFIMDLFCGTGGFSRGFERHSDAFSVAYAIDCWGVATRTAQANHPNSVVTCDDIRRARPSYVKELLKSLTVDVIIGGPPCQGFSSLRPFRSSNDDDPRNSLFEQFALFVNYFRPRVFVLENVVGLLTHNNGDTLGRIHECFSAMKYDCDWRILNAANYGVPQKRERFIFVGVEEGGRFEFPEPTHSFREKTIGYRDKGKMIVDPGCLFLPRAISVMDAIGDLPAIRSGEKATEYNKAPENEYQRNRRRNSKALALHEACSHSRKILEIIRHAGDSIKSIPGHLVTSGFSSCYSRLRPDEPSTTITVKFTSPSSNKCIHPYQDRSITPREAARLQGFDDDFVFCGSKTDVAKQIGNAVPPLLGEAIARSVYNML